MLADGSSVPIAFASEALLPQVANDDDAWLCEDCQQNGAIETARLTRLARLMREVSSVGNPSAVCRWLRMKCGTEAKLAPLQVRASALGTSENAWVGAGCRFVVSEPKYAAARVPLTARQACLHFSSPAVSLITPSSALLPSQCARPTIG